MVMPIVSLTQSGDGMPLNVGDYVRFPNPQAGQPSYAYGQISQLIPGNVQVVIAYPYGGASPVLGSATVASNTVYQMGAAGGPGNSESNRGV